MQVKYYARACGRVQGVGFRYFVQYSAVALQIGGWVRNCDDGSVDMYLMEIVKQSSSFCEKFAREVCGFRSIPLM